MTNQEYHGDHSAVSQSMLKVYRRSPALYHALYVAHTMEPDAPTPDMLVGSALHSLWLTPAQFGAEYAVAPKCDRRTNIGKAQWSDFVDSADGKAMLDQGQYDLVRAMADALADNPVARALRDVAEPIIERPIFWDDAGLRRKARPDIVVKAGITEWNLCVDLKTTTSPGDGFARQAANLGYHNQAAWYLDACRAEYGEFGDSDHAADWRFLILAVGNEKPHDVYSYRLGYDWLSVGVEQNAEQMRLLRKSIETGQWLAPEQTTISDLPMPKWLQYQGEIL